MSDLPGSELIAAGLAGLERGEESVPALLVSIGSPRLCRLGYVVPNRFDGSIPGHFGRRPS